MLFRWIKMIKNDEKLLEDVLETYANVMGYSDEELQEMVEKGSTNI
jgi:tape measure domain-containing protein